MYFFSYVIIIW